jgi:hypothetical protein
MECVLAGRCCCGATSPGGLDGPMGGRLLRGKDSNLQPPGPEPGALPIALPLMVERGWRSRT